MRSIAMSRALRASREGGERSAESNKPPPPHPSPMSTSDVSDLDQLSMAELGNTRVRLGGGSRMRPARSQMRLPCREREGSRSVQEATGSKPVGSHPAPASPA